MDDRKNNYKAETQVELHLISQPSWREPDLGGNPTFRVDLARCRFDVRSEDFNTTSNRMGKGERRH
jgi:hypothetical protein